MPEPTKPQPVAVRLQVGDGPANVIGDIHNASSVEDVLDELVPLLRATADEIEWNRTLERAGVNSEADQ